MSKAQEGRVEASADSIPSYSTFCRVYLKWRHCLRIRKLSQHARCATCAALSRRRDQANNEHEKAQIQKAKEDHIATVIADRTSEERLNKMAEQNLIMKIDTDGMDEAKFKCPRMVESNKVVEALWKPQIHLSGFIVWGVPRLVVGKFRNINCKTWESSRCI